MGTMGALRTACAVGLLGGLGVSLSAPAGAAGAGAAGATPTCTGSPAAPGVLAGTYPSGVVVSGYCDVDGGPTVVDGNLTIAAGATLNATFASDEVSGTGPSSLAVSGNLKVGRGATLAMGCEPVHMPCADDPTGTRTGSDRVGGNLVGPGALGMVVHAATVVGNITESGGGGGPSCVPPSTGYFGQIGYPVYSDFEDDTVGGNLRVVRLQTCWLGMLRDTVQGNLTDSANTFADPDANETLANTVHRNMVCSGNSPAVHYGDSGGSPNLVHGHASGECSFTASTAGQPIALKS
jgi:hypothetical protein